jgi:hypothetical protein
MTSARNAVNTTWASERPVVEDEVEQGVEEGVQRGAGRAAGAQRRIPGPYGLPQRRERAPVRVLVDAYAGLGRQPARRGALPDRA